MKIDIILQKILSKIQYLKAILTEAIICHSITNNM